AARRWASLVADGGLPRAVAPGAGPGAGRGPGLGQLLPGQLAGRHLHAVDVAPRGGRPRRAGDRQPGPAEPAADADQYRPGQQRAGLQGEPLRRLFLVRHGTVLVSSPVLATLAGPGTCGHHPDRVIAIPRSGTALTLSRL